MLNNPLAHAGDKRDAVSIPGLGRSPRGRHGNTLYYRTEEPGGLQSVGVTKS